VVSGQSLDCRSDVNIVSLPLANDDGSLRVVEVLEHQEAPVLAFFQTHLCLGVVPAMFEY
jgi:hypothetical protein